MTAKSAYDKKELIACGHGELFGPGNAQLPTDNMLMLDRITHISSEGGAHGRGEIIAELDIRPVITSYSIHYTKLYEIPPPSTSSPKRCWLPLRSSRSSAPRRSSCSDPRRS